MIDAAIAASVKRIVLSEYSTNLESPLARKLRMVKGKVETCDYATSIIPQTTSSATWTSINNGPFFEMCLQFSSLGPNLAKKSAVYHNGGEIVVGEFRLADIGTAVAKVLDAEHFEQTANQPVYIYPAAISERHMTRLASEVTGTDFDAVEDSKIPDLDTEQLMLEADEKIAKGDMPAMFQNYFQMMYGKGYGGDTQHMSWDEHLGLKTMTDNDLKEAIRQTAQELGVI